MTKQMKLSWGTLITGLVLLVGCGKEQSLVVGGGRTDDKPIFGAMQGVSGQAGYKVDFNAVPDVPPVVMSAAPEQPPATPVETAQAKSKRGPGTCEFNGANAANQCIAEWRTHGEEKNNHFCKDKSRVKKTKGWDCFNIVEDTSNGWKCVDYCPSGTPSCEAGLDMYDNHHKFVGKTTGHCDEGHTSPNRVVKNDYTGRFFGPWRRAEGTIAEW